MASEILPKLNHCKGMNASEKDAFRRTVKGFSTFAWLKYQELYPELSLPPSIITIGPDFISHDINEKFKTDTPNKPVKNGLDFSQAIVSRGGIDIGELPSGSSLNGYFDYLFEHDELQPAYTLLVADDDEWERIRGTQRVGARHDDFVVHNYLVGNEIIEVWAFDVLNPVVRQPLNNSGSISITKAKNDQDW